MTDSKSSWWQTIPGILTALAAAITAVGGLLVTLDKVGLIGGRSGSAPPGLTADPPAPAGPSSGGQAAETAAAGAAAPRTRAARYSVQFTGITEAKVRSNRADGVYKVLGATVEDRGTGALILTVTIQLTNVGRSDIAFSTDYIRLLVDGQPRAPISSLIDAVDANSAEQAGIVFELPETATNLDLLIDNTEDSARLPLVLKKQG